MADIRLSEGIPGDNPPNGFASLYIDPTDGELKRLNSTGQVVDIESITTDKIKTINSPSDLPALSGGVYPLVSNTTYIQGADLILGNPLDLSAGGITWTSLNRFAPSLTNSTSTIFLKVGTLSASVKECVLNGIGNPNPLFDVNGGTLAEFVCANITLAGNDFGNFTNLRRLIIQNCGGPINGSINTFGAAWEELRIKDNVLVALSTNTLVDLGTFTASSTLR